MGMGLAKYVRGRQYSHPSLQPLAVLTHMTSEPDIARDIRFRSHVDQCRR